MSQAAPDRLAIWTCGTAPCVNQAPARRMLTMVDKHANMPGMGDQPSKPGKTPVKAKNAAKSKPSDKSAHHDTAGHQHPPKKA